MTVRRSEKPRGKPAAGARDDGGVAGGAATRTGGSAARKGGAPAGDGGAAAGNGSAAASAGSDGAGLVRRGRIGHGSHEDPTDERQRRGRPKKTGRPRGA
jgi:excinuclease ABC subunit B